jgi:nucleoid DNA-binding protein
MKPNKTINLVDLSKRCGLYNFKCVYCGKENKAIEALRKLFNLIIEEAGKAKIVKIANFGVFSVVRWKAPNAPMFKNLNHIHRLVFKPSKTAKAKMLQTIKEE